MHINKITDIDLSNKRVFIRCDFNVPVDEFGNISDDRRIKAALPTIRYCLDRDCKIILASHFGRPTADKFEGKYSLSFVSKRLHALLQKEIIMSKDVIGKDTQEKSKKLNNGDILLLENLRFDAKEIQNSDEFASQLASLADVYINDAFGACHRKHASISAMAYKFNTDNRGAGFLLSKEINFFHRVLENPVRPFVAVVGGSKVSGKLQALVRLIEKVDKIIIGGGMAFTFLKALGHEIGNSLVENDLIQEAKNVMDKAIELGVKFYLPVDIVIATEFSDASTIKYVPIQEIPKGWIGLDVGPASSRLFREALNDAQTVLWNGPMGVYELDKFSKGSVKMSHYISETHATTIVGGGDTADVAARAGDVDEMTFVSTGGGASLELLEGNLLPGVEALLTKEES